MPDTIGVHSMSALLLRLGAKPFFEVLPKVCPNVQASKAASPTHGSSMMCRHGGRGRGRGAPVDANGVDTRSRAPVGATNNSDIPQDAVMAAGPPGESAGTSNNRNVGGPAQAFDASEAQAILASRFEAARASSDLTEHAEKPQCAWGAKVRLVPTPVGAHTALNSMRLHYNPDDDIMAASMTHVGILCSVANCQKSRHGSCVLSSVAKIHSCVQSPLDFAAQVAKKAARKPEGS